MTVQHIVAPSPGELLDLVGDGRGRFPPGTEDALALAVANLLRQVTLEGRFRGVWWHSANELAGLSPKHGGIARALGMIGGAPDLVCLGARGALALELKTVKGRQSRRQRLFERWALSEGCPYIVCRSVEEVLSVLTGHGFIGAL